MHPSDEELQAFSTARKQLATQGAVASHPHVNGCEECQEALALFDEQDEAFRNPVVWADVPLFLKSPQRLAEFLAAKELRAREQAKSLRRLSEHLKSAAHFDAEAIVTNAAYHDPHVVRTLVDVAEARQELEPKFALVASRTACDIARKLLVRSPESEALLLLFARALRERAKALRFAGEFKAADAALNECESIFRRLSNSAFDLAIVEYVRSTIAIQFDERAHDALKSAQSARLIFREFEDEHRELAAMLVESEAVGTVSGRAAAAEAYEQVIALALRLRQAAIAAHAYYNAATAYADIGEIGKAEIYYIEALARYDQLENAAGAANTEWQLGRLLLLRGQLETGATALEAARRKLLDLGLFEDHALATLDWGGARLALGEPEGVAAACQQIIPRYVAEGAVRNARLALAEVHEALRQGTATADLLRDVRDYLEQLPLHPSVAFRPRA